MAEAVNVWNEESIELYLKNEIAQGEQPLGDYLALALGRTLRKADSQKGHLKQVKFTTMPDNAPEWMRKKFPTGGAFEEFRATPELDQTVHHIADWIKGAIISQEAWLQDKDDHGRPVRLREIGSIERATNYANEAMQRLRATTAIEEQPGDSEEIRTWPGGYRIVRLLTPSALDRESQQLGHCIGNGAYDDKVAKIDSYAYYSLRDPLNKSHATFEVDVRRHTLLQCKGKADKTPVRRYMPYVKDFILAQKWNLKEGASHTGLVKEKGLYYIIYDLPGNFKGTLNLRDCTDLTSLPDNLSVEGDFMLNGCTGLASLPDNLSVEGEIYLTDCTGLTSLPDRFSSKGFLNLFGCTGLTSLPDNLSVEGSLYLNGCTGITSLPKNLHVAGEIIGFSKYLQTVQSSPSGTRARG